MKNKENKSAENFYKTLYVAILLQNWDPKHYLKNELILAFQVNRKNTPKLPSPLVTKQYQIEPFI